MARAPSFPFTSCTDEPTARQLYELLVSNMHSIFQSSIEQLTAHGYNEDDAIAAMSRSSLYTNRHDAVSSIVDDALSFLRKNQKVDEDHIFDDLDHMAKYAVLEMANVLIEVKPSLTAVEALWWLVVCDADVTLACSVAEPPQSSADEDWTQWADSKIVQVARILIRDKDKLESLRNMDGREEKDQVLAKVRTAERLADMEAALSDASTVHDRATESVRSLQRDNSIEKEELEREKRRVEEAVAQHREILEREQEMLMKARAMEGLKEHLQEGVRAEKTKGSQLREKMSESQCGRNEIEAKLRREQAETDALRAQLALIRQGRGQIREMEKEEEERARQETERAMQQYAQAKVKLERKFAKLKLEIESSRIKALKHGTSASCSTTSSSHVDPNEAQLQLRQERECVMCLSEEREIVFLPCSHQVLCSGCNQLHVQSNMTECPSCRTSIQQRIQARFGRNS